MNKDEQIRNRIEELKQYYEYLSEEQKSLAFPLIENVAFIENQLEKLQRIIEEEGTIDEYQNGNNQKGKKQSANLQSYTSLLKSYNTINSRLEDMLSDVKQNIEKKEKSLETLIKELEDDFENESEDPLFYEAE